MKDLEKTLKALANRRRLMILKYLKHNDQANVSAIAEEIDLSFKSTSKHLGVLFAANILEKDQRSLMMYYRIASNQAPACRHIISVL